LRASILGENLHSGVTEFSRTKAEAWRTLNSVWRTQNSVWRTLNSADGA
jgi:hypothetical protein